MLLHYLKIAWRNLLRNKTYSIINISGFSIGIAVSLLIFVYTYDELKYDRHFQKEHVYRLYGNNFNVKSFSVGQPALFMPVVLNNIPEVKNGVRLEFGSATLKINKTTYTETNFAHADSTIFNVLEIKLIEGNPQRALNDPFSILISQTTAKRFFGETDPTGEVILQDNQHEFTITGIFQDLPRHSHLEFNYLASMSTKKHTNPLLLEHWGNFGTAQYYVLNPEADPVETQKKITALWKNTDKPQLGERTGDIQLKLQPYEDIYLHSAGINQSGQIKTGNIYSVMGFACIAVLILFIACFNYLNLTTAKMSLKGKEVGIRKSIGAQKSELIGQYMSESFLFVVLSMSLSIILIEIFFHEFRTIIQKDIPIDELHSPQFFLFMVLIVIFITFGAGFYPAFMLSSFSPSLILKGSTDFNYRSTRNSFHGFIKNSLVFGQFFIAITLVMGTIFIARQINFLRKSDFGYNREQVLVISNPWNEGMHRRYQRFFNEVSQIAEISSIGTGVNVPPAGISNWGYPKMKNTGIAIEQVGFLWVDHNYLRTLGTEIVEGRDFHPNLTSDSLAIIVNEAFVRAAGIENIIGEIFTNFWDQDERTVIGVVKDIHFTSAHEEVRPCVFLMSKNMPSVVHVLLRLKSDNYQESLKSIEKAWATAAPEWPFSYFFLDEKFEANYNREVRTEKLLRAFSLFAIFLCLIGIGGLVLFSTQNKTKEIGIRKVMGASFAQILVLLSKNFLLWGLLAFVVSCPIVYYLLTTWLQVFVYKINIDWWVFVNSGIVSLLIALLVIIIQILKSARANPVDSLRYE